MEIEYALAAVIYEISIIEDPPGSVHGGLRIRSGDVNKEGVERAYGCETRQAHDSGYPDWLCDVEFDREEPDWKTLLMELDSAGMMNPPADPPPPPLSACIDGSPWKLTVLQRGSEAPLVEDDLACPPAVTAERKRYEEVVEEVIGRVLDLAER